MEQEIQEEIITEEVTTPETEEVTEDVEEIKAKAEQLAKEKEELEKKLKTALIQKEKKDEKLKNANNAASNDEVKNLKAEIELIKFQSAHNDLSSDELKLISRFRQDGQSLEDVYNDEEVKSLIETKRFKREIEEWTISFSDRSTVSGVKGMSAIEVALSQNLPPGYKSK